MNGDRQTAADRVERVIRRLAETRTAIDADGVERTVFPVALPSEEAGALTDWVCREGAAHTIEIGLAFAFSALHICRGLILGENPGARHTTMDPYQIVGYSKVGLNILEEAGVRDMVEHHNEQSQIVLPRFLEEERTYDLAFIDGNHRFDHVFVDLFYLAKLVRMGGVVLLDDYGLPGIRRAVSFFTTNLGWELLDTVNDRVVVLRTATKPDERDFRYFVEF